jgi:hypothetical protein
MSESFCMIVFPYGGGVTSIADANRILPPNTSIIEELTFEEHLAIEPEGKHIGFVFLDHCFLIFANDPMILEEHFLQDKQLNVFSKRAYLVYDEVSMTFVVKYRDIEGRSVDYIESDGEIMENDFNGLAFEFEQGDELLHQVFEMVAGVHFYEIDESTPMTLMVVKD